MQKLITLITEAIRSLYSVDYIPDISPAPKAELGEYCINVFPLAKSAGKAPNILAEEIATALTKHTDTFVSTSATGGYVNFFLADTVWLRLFKDAKNQEPKTKNSETIVVDYIGANTGKPMHIGHICTPSIGQVVINTYRHLGYDVISDSHFGDWGGIFGKMISIGKKINTDTKTLIENVDTKGVDYLLYLYQEFHKNPTEEDEINARREFKKLTEGDNENVELWKKFTAISLDEAEKKLKLLNVETTYNIGESFYEGLGLPRPNGEDYPDLEYTMKDIVKELIEKGVATQNEDGSVGVVFSEESKIPSCILQKKDGTGLYLTSDLAAIKYRLTNGWNPSKLIYCVDVRQQLHLKQAFTIARLAWPELTENVELFHAFNGFIKLKEGAMSTRHGTVIFLEKLIEEGNERTAQILEEKGRTGEKMLEKEDIQAITVAAIKYSYLAQDREKDVTFDWDKALNFEGNSGPYIQYAYVRAKKISGDKIIQGVSGDIILSSYDKSLIQKLAEFESIVETTAKTYKPHHLALYAYSLAVTFNSFYVHTPKILEESDVSLKQLRLTLVAQSAETLKTAFSLLAIEMPSEM